ncbi:aminotransferase class V [Lobosporangium transversale]|uniref:alanine--glyoxylate transaminase n=1 Tax=Lobosporangium transversale TaxID=64571 RepID=A0A1Y2GWA3_9FUNG|nr:aminotransferase class V [Lobosporangium transversale]ORZ26586.1 aminotransferase class V [Lobosporangium transversale]|eukprot:XP_021884349.1 aminotransferase class V [Lobosporangium transversale]
MEQPRTHLVPGPTIVPQRLKDLYSNSFYGSGDLEPECLKVYNECCSRLQKLLSFEPHQQKQADSDDGSIVIMSGEAMAGLWGGLKSLIPWVYDYDAKGDLVFSKDLFANKYRVLCIGNGVYGDGIYDMVRSLRYPNVEVKAAQGPWDQPVNVEQVLETIHQWKPDLVTMVHCDTPTGVLNTEAVRMIGEACSKADALFYVDIVSSAGATPIEVSAWNIDIGLVGSQKTFSCEPSLAVITVSSKAWKQIKKVAYIGYDALLPFKTLEKEFPYTPLWSAIDALNEQLKATYGENNEHVQEVYARHEEVAKYCRERVKKMGLQLWWDQERVSLNSPSVTAIRVPENTTWEELDKKLRNEGVLLGGSYGQTANAIFRIGHMGTQADLRIVTYALDALEKIIMQEQ